MYVLLSILLIIVAIFLIIAVLLQPGKGDMGATFGGGLGSQMGAMFGMQKTVSLLAKITRILAIAILLITLMVNKFFLTPKTEAEKPVTEGASTQTEMPVSAPPVSSPAEAPQQ